MNCPIEDGIVGILRANILLALGWVFKRSPLFSPVPLEPLAPLDEVLNTPALTRV